MIGKYSVWVLSGYSSFLPQSKEMCNWDNRLIGDSKLVIGVPMSVNGCLSIFVSPLADWQPIQAVPCLCPMAAGIGSSPPRDRYGGLSGR